MIYFQNDSILTSNIKTPAIPNTQYCKTGHMISMTCLLVRSKAFVELTVLTVLGVVNVLSLLEFCELTTVDGTFSGTVNGWFGK